VEDARRALLMYGNSTSQVIKGVLADLHKLKGVRPPPAFSSSSRPLARAPRRAAPPAPPPPAALS